MVVSTRSGGQGELERNNPDRVNHQRGRKVSMKSKPKRRKRPSRRK